MMIFLVFFFPFIPACVAHLQHRQGGDVLAQSCPLLRAVAAKCEYPANTRAQTTTQHNTHMLTSNVLAVALLPYLAVITISCV